MSAWPKAYYPDAAEYRLFCEAMRGLESCGVTVPAVYFDPEYFADAADGGAGSSIAAAVTTFRKKDLVPKDLLNEYPGLFYGAAERVQAEEAEEEEAEEEDEAQTKQERRRQGQERFMEGVARKAAAHVNGVVQEALKQASPARREACQRFWLPNDVFAMGLTRPEFVLYAYLARRAGKSRVAWPSQKLIMAECHMNPKTVTRAVQGLVGKGMVDWQRGAFGRASKYRLTDPKDWTAPIIAPVDGAVTEG